MKQKQQIPKNDLLQQWKTGPISDHILEPGHGRGIFCMSVQGDSLVTGSADHGLREYSIKGMSHKRELYAKKYGHSEWVTSCAHLKDGKVISTGMDSKICLWDQKIVRCDHIMGHQGSITKVLVDENDIAITSSYDYTLMLWDLFSKKEAQKLFGPHRGPVLDFAWQNSLVVSGDKNGVIAIWDLNTAQPIKSAQVHKGAVSQIHLYSDGMSHFYIVSAGINDGSLCFHDMRTNKPVFHEQLHSGSINSVQSNLSSFIITGSADKTIKLVDVLGGFKIMNTMKASDGVFCLQPVYNFTVAGTGDGNVLCYDNDTGKCLYGFGAMSKGQVRQLSVTEDLSKLIVIGDDFSPVLLNYSQ